MAQTALRRERMPERPGRIPGIHADVHRPALAGTIFAGRPAGLL